MHLKVTVEEHENIEPELILRCPDAHAPQIQELLKLLTRTESRIPAQQHDDRLLLSPQEILYGEFVGRTVFLYTNEAVYPTSLSLKQLEADYYNFFRCSKSMIVNLNCIHRLKSQVGGRILTTLSNGEKLLISRHYAGSLRQRLDCAAQKRGTL